MLQNAYKVLNERGFIEWCSAPDDLIRLMDEERVTCYIGFDPTADSLHVGHLVPIMGLAWMQRLGHRPIPLTGGGTGLIGDPSGKSQERNLLTLEQVRHNMESVKAQLEKFLDFEAVPNGAIALNNYDWLSKLFLLDFLRDIGKHFSLNQMVSREYVKSRIEDPERSISFTEFSYMLLQAYDFLHLFTHYDCRLQMGGNDQQGNILGGVELIRKKTGKQAFGMTYPLLLTASGKKFGKTEEGTVWLSPERTRPYHFYQFWMNTEDRDVEKLLKLFTFLPLSEIAAIIEEHRASPEKRKAQKVLAWEVTKTVHGERAALSARKASEVLFGESFTPSELTEDLIRMLSAEVPTATLTLVEPLSVADLLAQSGATPSKGEARRLIRGGGVLLNGEKVFDEGMPISHDQLLWGRFAFLRLGKKRFYLVECRSAD